MTERNCKDHNLELSNFCQRCKKSLCPECIDVHNKSHTIPSFNYQKSQILKEAVGVDKAKKSIEDIFNENKATIAQYMLKEKSKKEAESLYNEIKKVVKFAKKKIIETTNMALYKEEGDLNELYQQIIQENAKKNEDLKKYEDLMKELEEKKGNDLYSIMNRYNELTSLNDLMRKYCDKNKKDKKFLDEGKIVENHSKKKDEIYEKVRDATKKYEESLMIIFGVGVESMKDEGTPKKKESKEDAIKRYYNSEEIGKPKPEEEKKLNLEDFIFYLDVSQSSALIYNTKLDKAKIFEIKEQLNYKSEYIMKDNNTIMLICGGCDKDKKTAYGNTKEIAFNFENNRKLSHKFKSDLKSERYNHTLLLIENYILCIGGCNTENKLASVEILSSSKWEETHALVEPAKNIAAVYFPADKKIYAFGGKTDKGFSGIISTNKFENGQLQEEWEKLETNLPEDWKVLIAITFHEKIYLFGGKYGEMCLKLKGTELKKKEKLKIPKEEKTKKLLKGSALIVNDEFYVVNHPNKSILCLNKTGWKIINYKKWAQY